ncbi:MAG: RdgB/HAM1 family non-canonical purine NTP pyrophosphatase [Ignavibacteriaceae bacterium]|jgi:XTP/dITP diphosphohydrolase|nr:RdgB/HAM1 family non-canonical purine NTP pyrophosphatase [Ignavibacteriaceae bacterium]
MKLLFATQNRGKLREVKEILNSSSIEVLSLIGLEDIPEVIEDGDTFEANARKKAVQFYEYFRVPVIADDSGLETEQLLGMPGVISARYSGENATDEKNNEKLLSELSKYPAPHKARFVCSAVYYDGKKFLSAYGHINGQITFESKGTNGFGYDPIFIPDGYNNTMAELPPEKKNSISHRSQAFTKLKSLL